MQTNDKISFRYSHPVSYDKPYVNANGQPLSNFSARHEELLRGDTPLRQALRDHDFEGRLGIAPHLELSLFATHQQVVVSSHQHKARLTGGVLLDILPLLAQGKYNAEQLAQQLSAKHSSLQVKTALYYLLSNHILVSTEHTLTAAQALYWATAGLTPCAAQQQLHALPLHMIHIPHKQEPLLASLLTKMQALGGWRHVDHPDDAAIVIYQVDNYLQDSIAAINKQHLADGKQWMLLQVRDDVSLCGPLFCPIPHSALTNRPCWACLRAALVENSHNLAEFLRHNKHQHLPRAKVSAELHVDALAMRLHQELSALLLKEDTASVPLRSHLLRLALPQMNCEYHWVAQRPQCRACCIDEAHWDAGRVPQPLQLKAQQATSFTSGGMRTRSTQAAFAQWRKHVSPLTGATDKIVYCRGTYYGADGSSWDWLHNTSGSKNQALVNNWLNRANAGFRELAGGKGSDATQSWVGAICESFERSAGVYKDRGELYKSACFNAFQAGEVIAPNTVALYSEAQYQHRETINALADPFNTVPMPLDYDEVTRWTPVWSLTEQRHKYLLTESLYYHKYETPQAAKRYACSNGCAGGATLAEATLQGLYELIERDACAIWWYNRLRLPPVELEQFDDPWLQRAKTFYAALQRDLWLLDMTSDLGVPACVALSHKTNTEQGKGVIFGFGAHLNPHIAALRAIAEMNQMLTYVEITVPEGVDIENWLKMTQNATAADWLMQVSTADQDFSWLLPDKSASLQKYANHACSDPVEEINYLRAIIENKGMELLVLDQSRSDIDYKVVKVIAPGLRHFWRRLAPGRLYDVPIAQGQLPRKYKEEELNPIAMFI